MDETKAAIENKKNHGSVFSVADLPEPYKGVPENSIRLVRMVAILQDLHSLDVTGIIDSQTVEAMGKPVPKPSLKTKKPKKKTTKKRPSAEDEAVEGGDLL